MQVSKDKDINQIPKEELMKHIFVPIGDSYTAGTGADAGEDWPSRLVAHLAEEGVAISMPVNPARNGWTSKQAVEFELPILRRNKATFSTLLIGANDLVQKVEPTTYQKNVQKLLDEMVNQTKGKVIVFTIPDFTITSVGSQFGRDMPDKIQEFNAILKEEAKKRNLLVIDLFSLTQEAFDASEDQLHPSAKEYERWETEIFPVVKELLGQ